MLRIRPQVGGAPANAKAFRIIYRSTGLNGEPIAVSATVIYPAGPPPEGGRDVIAWAHYTTGVAERCAPTLLPNLSGTIPGLEQMLARGYVVVATDYAGLGLPGVHAYLVGISEARVGARLGARRAQSEAARTPPNASPCGAIRRAATPRCSPASWPPRMRRELKLVGVAAAAPATNLVDLFKAQKGSIAGNSLTAMALLSWSRTYNLPLDSVLEDGAEASFEKVARKLHSVAVADAQSAAARQAAEEGVSSRSIRRRCRLGARSWRRTPQARHGSRHPCSSRKGTGDKNVNADITVRFAKHAVRRRDARRSEDDEERVAQLRRGKERLPGRRVDHRPLQGAPGAERLQARLTPSAPGNPAC